MTIQNFWIQSVGVLHIAAISQRTRIMGESIKKNDDKRIPILFRRSAIVLLTIAAFCQLVWIGKWIAVFFTVISGVSLVVGMQSGIENAPEQNLKRRSTKVQAVLFYTLMLAVMSTPAVIVGVFAGRYMGFFIGIVSTISSLWLTVFTGAVALKLMERWIGPIKYPEMPAKS